MSILSFFKKEKPAEAPQPVLGQVLGAMNADGHLPPGWSLPDDTPPNQLRFAPGGMDGIGVYHMAGSDYTKAVDALARLLEGACAKPGEYNKRRIADFLKEQRVLHLIDPLSDRIRGNQTSITPDSLLPLAYDLTINAIDAESVKLGIALLGLLNIEDNTDCREAIFQLGKYDEFTLYSVIAMSGWNDGEDLIFKLVKEVHGWGKIHAVERLDPNLSGVKDWIIRSGCQNDVVNAYLGLTCAEKGEMISFLREEHMEPDVFSGVSIIIDALLDEGPVQGISAYNHAEEALRLYLIHAVSLCNSLHLLSVVFNIRDWLENSKLDSKDELLLLFRDIIDLDRWETQVADAMKAGDSQNLFHACKTAERLGLDISESVWNLMENKPLECAAYLWVLRNSSEHIKKAIALYERTLPLKAIASGMGDLLGLGTEFKAHGCLDWILQEMNPYPEIGVALVKAGLGSPVVRNRNGACNVLEAWLQTGWTPDADLVQTVRGVAMREVNDGLKKRFGEMAVMIP